MGSQGPRSKPTATSILETLKKELADAHRPAAGQNGHTFVPDSDLNRIVSEEVLESLIQHEAFGIPAYRRQSICQNVTKKYRKVFAILIQLGHESSISSLVERQLTDSRLPINTYELHTLLPRFHQAFYRLQWSYTAQHFCKNDIEQILCPTTILPYLEETEIGSGGYGVVYKTKLHGHHQDFVKLNNGQGLEIARKCINESVLATNKLLQETETLFLLSDIRHKNILPILAAYRQGKSLNILFPLADMDLGRLLQNPPPQWLAETRGVLKALYGLADGLNHIHNFKASFLNDNMLELHGIHHDLKPQNILVLEDQLVIADFGLCQLKPIQQSSRTQWKDSTIEYGAPESRDPETWVANEIGRAFDIWSLGAIMLELCVYMIYGQEGVQSFQEDRTYSDTFGNTRSFHQNGKCHQSVADRFDLLKSSTTEQSIIALFELIESMLDPNQQTRPTSARVVKCLGRILSGYTTESILHILDEILEKPQVAKVGRLALARIFLERNRLLAFYQVITQDNGGSRFATAVLPPAMDFQESLKCMEHGLELLDQLPTEKLTANEFQNVFMILSRLNDELYKSQDEKGKTLVDDTFGILNATTQGAASKAAFRELSRRPVLSKYPQESLTVSARYMAQILAGHIPMELTLPRKPLSAILLEESQDATYPLTYWYNIGHGGEPKIKTLVEWREYGTKWKDDNSEESRRIGQTLLRYVTVLVEMLQKSKIGDFRTLECMGFLHKPKQGAFGLVFRFPYQNRNAVTLHALLENQRDKRQQPSLTQKFCLARALARALHKLHLANWLHKCFWSQNIIFFSEYENTFFLTAVDQPYIRGFEYSRPHGADEYSEKPNYDKEEMRYQHPNYCQNTSQAYQRAYDYYSFGLILLEIALWRPLKRIYKDQHSSGATAEQLRGFYIGYCQEYVGKNMGDLYLEATLACLNGMVSKGEVGESEQEERAEHLAFQEQVLNRLESCRV